MVVIIMQYVNLSNKHLVLHSVPLKTYTTYQLYLSKNKFYEREKTAPLPGI